MKAKATADQSAELAERQWTRKLKDQAMRWQTAKPDGRYLSDQGVPVVRRHKRAAIRRSAA